MELLSQPHKMVEVTGFEPATSASRTQRSTKLSHTSLFNESYYNTLFPALQERIKKYFCKKHLTF